jgi:type III pantothenate kinase
MSLNFLAIDIGNTRIHLGTFLQGCLETIEMVTIDQLAEPLEAAHKALQDMDGACAIVSSVNKEAAKQVIKQLQLPVNQVEKDIQIPIGRQFDPEAIIGEDRLLNAAAAYDVLKQACVVVDVGTAITIDFVDGEGTFHGGAIAPGPRLMLQSLHEHTDQLPQIDFAAPVEPIGHSTVEAMRTAAYYGIRGMVRELVEQYADQTGAFPTVIATGGDAEVLFRDYDLIDRIVPELTLMGMAVALRAAVEQEQ